MHRANSLIMSVNLIMRQDLKHLNKYGLQPSVFQTKKYRYPIPIEEKESTVSDLGDKPLLY